jgi:hypothetical protein
MVGKNPPGIAIRGTGADIRPLENRNAPARLRELVSNRNSDGTCADDGDIAVSNMISPSVF